MCKIRFCYGKRQFFLLIFTSSMGWLFSLKIENCDQSKQEFQANGINSVTMYLYRRITYVQPCWLVIQGKKLPKAIQTNNDKKTTRKRKNINRTKHTKLIITDVYVGNQCKQRYYYRPHFKRLERITLSPDTKKNVVIGIQEKFHQSRVQFILGCSCSYLLYSRSHSSLQFLVRFLRYSSFSLDCITYFHVLKLLSYAQLIQN